MTKGTFALPLARQAFLVFLLFLTTLPFCIAEDQLKLPDADITGKYQ